MPVRKKEFLVDLLKNSNWITVRKFVGDNILNAMTDLVGATVNTFCRFFIDECQVNSFVYSSYKQILKQV